MRIFTIGHSSLDLDTFLGLLASFGVRALVDVRSMPGSRYVPQFNREALSLELPQKQIAYLHFPQLGGRRKSSREEDRRPVEGWKNSSFRNYASYTMTGEYEEGIDALIAEARDKPVCIMCAESVPWRCHRLLIANTLVSRGVDVVHIMGEGKSVSHALGLYGAPPEVDGKKVIYPAPPP